MNRDLFDVKMRWEADIWLPSASSPSASAPAAEHLRHNFQLVQPRVHRLFSFSENLDELGGALLILLGEECVSRPFVVAPASPPDPVNVVFVLHRVIVVHHKLDIVHVFKFVAIT